MIASAHDEAGLFRANFAQSELVGVVFRSSWTDAGGDAIVTSIDKPTCRCKRQTAPLAVFTVVDLQLAALELLINLYKGRLNRFDRLAPLAQRSRHAKHLAA